MPILTLKERFNQTPRAKKIHKSLKQHATRCGTQFTWNKNRPNLDSTRDLINLSQLHIDTETQRDPFSSSRVRIFMRMIANPCERRFARVVVANRKYTKGSQQHVIVEGQGRALVAYAMGETAVPYDEYTFTSKIDEATFFLNQGKDVHNIKDWEKHRVILGIPAHGRHTQAQDVERCVDLAGVEYEPLKIQKYDCSAAYSGIRYAVVTLEKVSNKSKLKAGERTCITAAAIIKLMIKYADHNDSLVLRSDLFYPMTEFILSYKSPKTGLKKLEERMKSLQETNGGTITLANMATACSLNICKNVKDKIACSTSIKKW